MPLKQVDSREEKTQALKNTSSFFLCTDRNQIFNFPSGKEMNGNSEKGHFPQPEKRVQCVLAGWLRRVSLCTLSGDKSHTDREGNCVWQLRSKHDPSWSMLHGSVFRNDNMPGISSLKCDLPLFTPHRPPQTGLTHEEGGVCKARLPHFHSFKPKIINKQQRHASRWFLFLLSLSLIFSNTLPEVEEPAATRLVPVSAWRRQRCEWCADWGISRRISLGKCWQWRKSRPASWRTRTRGSAAP